MGFGAFGNQGATLRPTSVGRNRAKPPTIGVAGYETEAANAFGLAHQMFVAGESFPRMAVYPSSLAGGGGAAAPDASLAYGSPPSGASAGAVGAWQHNGVRIADLNWRNVKHWGAVGDGSTDDRVAIQACINAGNGTVYFPPGTFMLGSTVSLPSNVRLVGAGQFRTTIMALSSMTTQTTMFSNSGLSGWTTSAQVSNVSFDDLTIDGNYTVRTGTGGGHLIWFRGPNSAPCQRIHVRRCRLINSTTMGVALQNCQRCHIAQNEVVACQRDGISFWGAASFNRVDHNLIESCTDDAIAFNATAADVSGNNIQVDSRDNVVMGNVCGPNLAGGGSGVALTGNKRTTVVGNTIFNYVNAGIRLIFFKNTPAQGATDNVVVGNTIMFTDQGPIVGGGHNGNGIVVATGDSATFGGTGSHGNVARLTIANNHIWNPRGHGIWIMTSANGGTISDVRIVDNVIDGESGSGMDTNSSGILVGGANNSSFGGTRSQHYLAAVTAISDVTIRGNKLGRLPYYGIRCHGVVRPVVVENEVLQCGLSTTAPGISLNACTDSMVQGNRSRNTSGSGQTYGIEFVANAGTSICTQNLVLNNATSGIIHSSAAGTLYAWDNPGQIAGTLARNAPTV
jgi:hypothetical protein